MLKRLTALCLSLLLCVSFSNVSVPVTASESDALLYASTYVAPVRKTEPTASALLSGTGIETDPYIVEKAEELLYIAQRISEGDINYASAYYRQTGDIDLTGTAFTPIGTSENAFTGVYDGAHYRITLKNYTKTVSDNLFGLFGYARCADFQNMDVIMEATINYSGSSTFYVGSICAMYEADAKTSGLYEITGCCARGSLSVSGTAAVNLGGLFGKIYTKTGLVHISDCASSLSLSAQSSKMAYAGGLIANVSAVGSGQCSIERCFTSGNIVASCTPSSAYVGGIVANFTPIDDDGGWSAWYETTLLNTDHHLRACFTTAVLQAHGKTTSTTKIGYICAEKAETAVLEDAYYVSNAQTAPSTGLKVYHGEEITKKALFDAVFLSDTLGFSLDKVWHLDETGALSLLHPCLNVRMNASSLKVRVADHKKASLLLAFSDKEGRLVSTALHQASAYGDEEFTVDCPDAESAHVFLLAQGTLAPLTQPKSADLKASAN